MTKIKIKDLLDVSAVLKKLLSNNSFTIDTLAKLEPIEKELTELVKPIIKKMETFFNGKEDIKKELQSFFMKEIKESDLSKKAIEMKNENEKYLEQEVEISIEKIPINVKMNMVEYKILKKFL